MGTARSTLMKFDGWDLALLLAILICLALQAWLALVMEINWDEFFFLSHIYSYQRGDAVGALQTFHVHLLGWLTSVPGDEINQIIVGRIFMLLCEGGTCVLIYGLGRQFASRTGALVAVLAFASAGFTIIHGASFRADPLAALVMMGALLVLARSRQSMLSMAATAALAAIGAIITVKVGLYAPAFVGVAAWRVGSAAERRPVALWIAGVAATTAMMFVALYLIQLGLVPQATDAASRSGLGNAAGTQVGAGFLPRAAEVLKFFSLSPLQVLLLAVGAVAGVFMLRRAEDRPKAMAVLGCGATLLCLLFYRNAFPYFFPFILAPAAILCALAIEEAEPLQRHPLLLVASLSVPAIAVAITWSSHDLRAQHQLVSVVHHIFPNSVAYIDRNSMIGSFPKRGFFMSTWGMQNYRLRGEAVFPRLLEQEAVPLVIANGPALQAAFGHLQGLPAQYSLFDGDRAALRDNYIPHWGPLWVAGKVIHATPRGTRFAIAIPGTYTVEGANSSIDDQPFAIGQTVSLSRGLHTFTGQAGTTVTLRWGDHLPRNFPEWAGPVYRGF